MVAPDQVKEYIQNGLDCTYIRVVGDGRHFQAWIASPAFEGLNTVKQHKLVYKALGDRMKEEIHALSMKTYSPDAWEQVKDQFETE